MGYSCLITGLSKLIHFYLAASKQINKEILRMTHFTTVLSIIQYSITSWTGVSGSVK